MSLDRRRPQYHPPPSRHGGPIFISVVGWLFSITVSEYSICLPGNIFFNSPRERSDDNGHQSFIVKTGEVIDQSRVSRTGLIHDLGVAFTRLRRGFNPRSHTGRCQQRYPGFQSDDTSFTARPEYMADSTLAPALSAPGAGRACSVHPHTYPRVCDPWANICEVSFCNIPNGAWLSGRGAWSVATRLEISISHCDHRGGCHPESQGAHRHSMSCVGLDGSSAIIA